MAANRRIRRYKTTMRKRRVEIFYQCPVCKLWYKDKKWAEKCKTWCKKHKSCNLEIIKHAIIK